MNVQKLAEEVLNGRSRINGNGVGQFFSLSAPLFLYLYDMDGTSPYERCSTADQGEALDKTKIARGPISASEHVTAKRNSPFLQGHSSTFTPDFQTQANKNCGILQYQHTQNISYTIQKTIKKKKKIKQNMLFQAQTWNSGKLPMETLPL